MERILAVDDEPNILKALRRILATSGYAMECVKSGEEALGRIPDFKPDLILLDIMMPGIDGYEVCRRLKSHPDTSGIMVVVVSAKITLKDRLKGYEVGADEYIAKPYDPEELRAKIRILLRLKRTQDELRELNTNLEHLVEIKTRELVSKERQAAIGHLLQGIVHNLRGPLTAVHGRADLIHRIVGEWLDVEVSKGGAEPFRSMAERILSNTEKLREAADRTDSLIDSLLVKGKKEADEKKVSLNLNEVIVQELRFLDSDLDFKHNVKKYLDLDPNIPEMNAVYSDLSQLIYNLAKNAADAMKDAEKRELTVFTKCDDQNAYMVFQDTGSGIAPGDMERIFDPFFSTKVAIDSPGAAGPTGTGLGLHICRELLKPYGGDISVRSISGQGSAFTVRIPREL